MHADPQMVEVSDKALHIVAAVGLCILTLQWAFAPPSVPSAEDIMLRRGTPIRISTEQHHGGQFSKWRCVGGLEDVDDVGHRTCSRPTRSVCQTLLGCKLSTCRCS